MKTKFKWILLSLSFSSTALGLGVFVSGNSNIFLTSDKVDSPKITVPKLKTSLTGVGGLDQFIKSSSKANDVNKNLKDLLNSNKEILITNWEMIPKDEQENIVLNPSFQNWTNDAWGSQTFDQWSTTASAQEVEWKGIGETANSSEILIFNSNSELKKFFSDNIFKIARNSIGDLGTKKVNLADADIKVDFNGNLLIPFFTDDSQVMRLNDGTRQINNYYLFVPSSNIKFNPIINLEAAYGQDNSISQEVSFIYTVTNAVEIESTFKEDVIAKKNIITLDEKGNSSNSIGLWERVSDVDILTKLGWLRNVSDLGSNHVDGSAIDSTFLNEDLIISDLKIDGLTKEKLLGIEIEMNQREVSQADYNGEYNILVSTTLQNVQDTDLNLNFNTYKIVSQVNADGVHHPLQVNVPNAYILDTFLDAGKFKKIDLAFFGEQSFEMGFKDFTSNTTGGIKANLEDDKISSKFINKIDESYKSKGISFQNGVIVRYSSNTWDANQDQYFKETISLSVQLKKGFAFKSNFSISVNNESVKYNNPNKLNIASFCIDNNTNNGITAIFRNLQKTVSEVSNSIHL